MKKEHTRHGPARYLGGIAHSQMQTIETATVQSGECTVLPSTKSEYVRDAGEVIGWDKGEDATWSFVECSGGVSSGRHYHGRPMAESNYKLGGRT